MAAEQGDSVTVEYTGRLDDGTVFDTSRDREPITFVIGEGQVIPGFEEAVLGMEPGDTKEAELAPEDAYGHRSDDRVFSVSRDELPEDLDPDLGDELEVRGENGQTFRVRVADTDESSVTLDANHPLAGEDLVFEIELVEIG